MTGDQSASTAALLAAFRARAGNEVHDLISLVLEISRVPYGRPREPTPDFVVRDWRGTCSTKHLLLAALAPMAHPGCEIALLHRVYRLRPAAAEAKWGPSVASVVPPAGLVDVHTYARVETGGRMTTVDVTFPLDDWDGRSDINLACEAGLDFPAGDNVLDSKAALVRRHCEPRLRERFIAALAQNTSTR